MNDADVLKTFCADLMHAKHFKTASELHVRAGHISQLYEAVVTHTYMAMPIIVHRKTF